MRRCEISGCIHEGCHSHHIVFRSQGGPDITMNLIRLCPYHHNMSPEEMAVYLFGSDAI